MPSYLYRAARADGTTLEGQAEGEDEQAVRAELERQGFLVFRLRPLGAWPALMGSRLWGRKRGIPLQEFLVFNQELLALVKAGLPILRIFDLLIERARRPAFQAVLRAVRQDIRGGTAMSDALARHPLFFPDLYIASLKAGEQAGNLPEVLQRYIVYLKLIMGLRQKMTKALAYPAFLVIVGAAVVGFLLPYVLPTFSSIYGEAGTNVPEATRALITIVEGIQSHLVWIGLAIVALVVAFKWWVRTETGRALWDRTTLTLPLVGDVLVKHQTIQFARTLATVLAGGTPLVSQLTTWIEPVLLLVMGLVVGAIVVVMYLPVFEMAGTVK